MRHPWPRWAMWTLCLLAVEGVTALAVPLLLLSFGFSLSYSVPGGRVTMFADLEWTFGILFAFTWLCGLAVAIVADVRHPRGCFLCRLPWDMDAPVIGRVLYHHVNRHARRLNRHLRLVK